MLVKWHLHGNELTGSTTGIFKSILPTESTIQFVCTKHPQEGRITQNSHPKSEEVGFLLVDVTSCTECSSVDTKVQQLIKDGWTVKTGILLSPRGDAMLHLVNAALHHVQAVEKDYQEKLTAFKINDWLVNNWDEASKLQMPAAQPTVEIACRNEYADANWLLYADPPFTRLLYSDIAINVNLKFGRVATMYDNVAKVYSKKFIQDDAVIDSIPKQISDLGKLWMAEQLVRLEMCKGVDETNNILMKEQLLFWEEWFVKLPDDKTRLRVLIDGIHGVLPNPRNAYPWLKPTWSPNSNIVTVPQVTTTVGELTILNAPTIPVIMSYANPTPVIGPRLNNNSVCATYFAQKYFTEIK